MPYFIKTDKDPLGQVLRIDAALRRRDGACFLVLRRLPPQYTLPPTFVVKLSGERLDQRGEAEYTYYKAYAIQDFSPKELKYLIDADAGREHTPFLRYAYPTVMSRFGKAVYKMTPAEFGPLVDDRFWKLIGGMR